MKIKDIDLTLDEYLEFRHKLKEYCKGTDYEWIEGFVEKLFLNYHSAYTQGRIDGMERVMYIQRGENAYI